jgi:hypothetical protein
MDLTHGSVLRDKQDLEILRDVPVYLSNTGVGFQQWGGCLHLKKNASELLDCGEYRIRLRDGRLGNICIRKFVSTNGDLHVEVLFEGKGPLAKGDQLIA